METSSFVFCISLEIMTLILFCLWKALQGNFENKRCLHETLVIFAFHEICFKIRFVLNELLYNNSACRFHHLNANKD